MGETMNGSAALSPRAGQPGRAMRTQRRALALIALAVIGVLFGAGRAKASQPALVVTPAPASGPALSYFKLSVARGRVAQAGTIGLRNPSGHSLRVVLAPVAGQTINTLGSTYGLQSRRVHGPASWLRIARSSVTLAPGQALAVPVSVAVPAPAHPGDFLAGVSVEELGQQTQSSSHKGASIASVVRYAIGVEITLPGPRHPLVAFTGARLKREPSGLTFLLDARNRGNVILQNARGNALVTKGKRVVARIPLGPGTFVTGTAIAYPILAPRERPHEGAVYRVRAALHYAGGTARLDTNVRFGHAAALRQQEYGGPKAASSGMPTWLVALLSVFGAAALAVTGGAYMARRRWGGLRSPAHVLETALARSSRQQEQLGLIVLDIGAGSGRPRELVRDMRSRLRHADRLCKVGDGRFLVIAPHTDHEATEALAGDMVRAAQRSQEGSAVSVAVLPPEDAQSSAAELLERIRSTDRYTQAPIPAG